MRPTDDPRAQARVWLAEHYAVDTRTTFDDLVEALVPLFERVARADELRTALEKSVRLQSLYATLLNQYDEGGRRTFVDAAAWIARLRETGHVE